MECVFICVYVNEEQMGLFMFRIVFWDVLLCKMIVDRPEDNSEHHSRRCENLKSRMGLFMSVVSFS
jgi:hypothetical protein